MSQIIQIAATIPPSAARNRNIGWFSSTNRLPALRRLVLYETQTSIRLGHIDEGGKWRRFDGVSESEQVLSWTIAKIAQTAMPAKNQQTSAPND